MHSSAEGHLDHHSTMFAYSHTIFLTNNPRPLRCIPSNEVAGSQGGCLSSEELRPVHQQQCGCARHRCNNTGSPCLCILPNMTAFLSLNCNHPDGSKV